MWHALIQTLNDTQEASKEPDRGGKNLMDFFSPLIYIIMYEAANQIYFLINQRYLDTVPGCSGSPEPLVSKLWLIDLQYKANAGIKSIYLNLHCLMDNGKV